MLAAANHAARASRDRADTERGDTGATMHIVAEGVGFTAGFQLAGARRGLAARARSRRRRSRSPRCLDREARRTARGSLPRRHAAAGPAAALVASLVGLVGQ